MTANLLSRLQGLTAPDREVDALIALHVGLPQEFFGPDFGTDRVDGPSCFEDHDSWAGGGRTYTAPYFTSSLDATVALCERVLPGWTWRVATCHVSDDAWVIPDFTHPIHGDRLMREFGQVEGDPTAYWQEITDVDLRPSGRPAIALLIAILTALEARENGN